MWSALCAIFISVAVGGGDSIMSTTRQTRVLWSTRVTGTHRQAQAQAIARATNTCAVQYDTRWGFPRSGLRDTHELGITLWDYPALSCAVARHIPRFYYLYKFKHFLKYINFLMYAI